MPWPPPTPSHLLFAVCHLPYVLIMFFLLVGLVERIGYFIWARHPRRGGTMPKWEDLPLVCVQLPMFNERRVADRIIMAACRMRWPREKFEVQVLDDSTEQAARDIVDDVCARASALLHPGKLQVLRRAVRTGYKAGALEEGRKKTKATFLAIFDADFEPSEGFLEDTMPHFYEDDVDCTPKYHMAFVQAQWGHSNYQDSFLTTMQSLWLDDHHTIQMSVRAHFLKFINFTGTSAVIRAQALKDTGGWRHESLVEDCEWSFRCLFEGYESTFVKEIVQHGELPNTYTAYKAQQLRWTKGWAQLIRIHFWQLMFAHKVGLVRKLYLLYFMCVSMQWLLWMVWLVEIPWLILSDLWFPDHLSTMPYSSIVFYNLPMVLWLVTMAVTASLSTRHSYEEPSKFSFRRGLLRAFRLVPYVVVNAGMLPHQASAFVEGLFTSFSEFERTPKAGGSPKVLPSPLPAPASAKSPSVNRPLLGAAEKDEEMMWKKARRKSRVPDEHVKIHWQVAVEVAFVVYQAFWAWYFVRSSSGFHRVYSSVAAVQAIFSGGAVALLFFFYYDHHPGHCCWWRLFNPRGWLHAAEPSD